MILEVSIFSMTGVTYLEKYYLLLYYTACQYNIVNKLLGFVLNKGFCIL